ncbi:MAG: hypothetical protein Q7T29_09260 [Gallionella sp.]|nr:hypothetical protein [Gallionella sp.]
MRHYRITLISLDMRIERRVIAHSTVQAIRIGISMMPECGGHHYYYRRPPMDTPTSLAIPELNEGEKYAFGITLPDGKTIHTILLPGDEVVPSWNAGMELAKNLGGDLPDRAEQALLFKYMPEEFKKDWYWSNTQHAGYSYDAWCQDFDNGNQDDDDKSCELRVRPVRRVTI